MKDILKHLYYGNMGEAQRPVKILNDCEEARKSVEYENKLRQLFSNEQEEIFEEYLQWEVAWMRTQQERGYINGVKTGFWLAMEMIDFQPESWKE